MFDVLRNDVRYAARSLRRSRGFTAAAVLTLALGIGLTTAIYSVVNAVLVEPIPFPDHERLAVVWETDRDTGTMREPASYPDFVDLRERSREAERIAAFVPVAINMAVEGRDPSRLAALDVSGDFFSLLGLTPAAGRLLTTDDVRPPAPDVAVISDRLWETHYNRDPLAVGRTIRLNSRPHVIVGVAPRHAGFGIPQILASAAYGQGFAARDRGGDVQVWRPLRTSAEQSPRATHGLMLVARLKPGATPEALQTELAAIAADLEREYPENQGRGIAVEPLADVVLGGIRPALIVLLAAVLFLLLIACVNVANLLLARATARAREVAVRTAIGASTSQLVRHFVIESIVLTTTAASLGVWLAFVGLQALLALAPAGIPRLADVAIDERVLLATSGIGLVIAIVFGLLPLAQTRTAVLQTTLRGDEGRGSAGDRRTRTRRAALVGVEVALAVALVIGAGLLIRTVAALREVDPGFDPTNVTKAEFQLPPTRYPVDFRTYPQASEIQRFNDTLLARVAELPGVESAALAGNQPLDVGFTNSFVIVGREAEAATWPEISIRRVTPEYFTTLRLRVVGGRPFDNRDGQTAPAVAMLNEAAARRFFPGQDPIGHQIGFWGSTRRIVGVVANEKFQGIAAPAAIAVYTPLAQAPSFDGAEALLVRASGEAVSGLAAAIRGIDPELTVFGVEPLDETLAKSIREQQFLMQLLAIFAGIALALAAVGIHGVVAYTVAQRTREIGLRMALGATLRDIVGLMLGRSVRVTVAGLLAGVALGLLLARSLGTWLYGVSPADPLTIAAVALVLGVTAAASAYFPTRRAVRIDPAITLRAE